MATKPTYQTPPNWACPYCEETGEIVALDNSFNYAGTHCTFGRSGTHYPAGWGSPVCSSCEAIIESAEIAEEGGDF